MSYSFNVRAATKDEAKALVADRLAAIVTNQAIHAADQAQAQNVADAFIDLLHEDPTQDVLVHVNGSLTHRYGEEPPKFTNASVGVSAYLVLKESP